MISLLPRFTALQFFPLHVIRRFFGEVILPSALRIWSLIRPRQPLPGPGEQASAHLNRKFSDRPCTLRISGLARAAPIPAHWHGRGAIRGGGGPVTWLLTSEPGEQVVDTFSVPPALGGYWPVVVNENVREPPTGMFASAENTPGPSSVPGGDTLVICTPEAAKNRMHWIGWSPVF